MSKTPEEIADEILQRYEDSPIDTVDMVSKLSKMLAEAIQDERDRAQGLVAALTFYSDNYTWNCGSDDQFGDQITYDDLEEDSEITNRRFVGGKRARQALADFRGEKV